MPTRKASQATGDIGVAITQMIVEQQLLWIFREQPKDFGIDAQVEVLEGEHPTGKLLALQIKTGPSYLQERTANGFVFRESLDLLDYWTKHSLAVIVVLCDPQTNTAWWAQITPREIEKLDKSFKLTVPYTNILNPSAKNRLSSIADGPEDLQRLRTLGMARPFMETIQKGGSVRLHVVVKTNTVFRRAQVVVTTSEGSPTTLEREIGPWLLLWPGADEGLANLEKLFPWAILKRDEEEEEQQREWLIEELHDQQHGQYFEGELMDHDLDYSDFAEQFEGMSYWEVKESTVDGEGYGATFDLALSPLGVSYLMLALHLGGT
ncbi:DUF4365 domain-containing protein [Myxococcus sp. Y35]|uniref:DUF4365 domain-containing protein n=1 Tax=Pseudomyxococcus flavus TaxID=3115648 RepID=UPI003CF7875B